MTHQEYFTSIDPSTTNDARDYVYSALRSLPEEWQGYRVAFSQYGLAQMLVDLGHARIGNNGSIFLKTTAGHTVFFPKDYPHLGFSKIEGTKLLHYAVIVPEGIIIDGRLYGIK